MSSRHYLCLAIILTFGMFLVSCSKNTESTNVVNVIIVTYSRSGSSYIGELLSSHENSSYFFEPLTYSYFVLHRTDSDATKHMMNELLTCNPDLMHNLADRRKGVWIIRKLGNLYPMFADIKVWPKERLKDMCLKSTVHVVKTIRLRLKEAHQMMIEGDVPNLRIVHLVRDPRGRFASAQKGNWNAQERSLDNICGAMEEDLQYFEAHKNQLNESVYLRLRYEDVIANPELYARQVHEKFYGIPYSQKVREYIEQHSHAEKLPENSALTTDYYATFRNTSFDPTAWKKELNQQQLFKIQNYCGYVIDQLKY